MRAFGTVVGDMLLDPETYVIQVSEVINMSRDNIDGEVYSELEDFSINYSH